MSLITRALVLLSVPQRCLGHRSTKHCGRLLPIKNPLKSTGKRAHTVHPLSPVSREGKERDATGSQMVLSSCPVNKAIKRQKKKLGDGRGEQCAPVFVHQGLCTETLLLKLILGCMWGEQDARVFVLDKVRVSHRMLVKAMCRRTTLQWTGLDQLTSVCLWWRALYSFLSSASLSSNLLTGWKTEPMT